MLVQHGVSVRLLVAKDYGTPATVRVRCRPKQLRNLNTPGLLLFMQVVLLAHGRM